MLLSLHSIAYARKKRKNVLKRSTATSRKIPHKHYKLTCLLSCKNDILAKQTEKSQGTQVGFTNLTIIFKQCYNLYKPLHYALSSLRFPVRKIFCREQTFSFLAPCKHLRTSPHSCMWKYILHKFDRWKSGEYPNNNAWNGDGYRNPNT